MNFELDQELRGYIKTVSSGNRKQSMTYQLIVNDESIVANAM